MTDTTTVDDEQPGTGPDVPHDEPIAISDQIGSGAHKPVKDRLLLPLLVPVLSAIAVGMLAVNISRIFLAGSEDAALVLGIVITLAILGGASLLAAAPRLHTSSLAMITGLIVVIIVSGGLLTLGPSLDSGEEAAACTPPTGDPVGTVNVEALQTIKFNATNYDAPPGVVEIDYSGAIGHTLAFREANVSCGELETPGPPNKEKVELKAGTTYNIFCTIPGHAAQGMEATITVAAS
ncbi:MAG TPA: plastocyanin/azurin family copper-binding protein [Acidimicrobiia bacterium]|nr:plastocyanin/azurin family copper-binding protein [Acidimicrobiia bacterium]